jgi:TetR/AcrR family transcriptional repressor of bet genes
MPKVVDHAERRRELISASWDVIAERGIQGVTLRNVALAAGCTTGRISHYFSGRDELLSSALRSAHKDASRRMMKIAGSGLAAKDRLQQVAFEGLPLDKGRLREWKVWIVFWAAAASSRNLADENATRYREWRNLLSELVHEASGKRGDDTLVDELMSIIDGIGIRITLNPGQKNRNLARELIAGWVSRL